VKTENVFGEFIVFNDRKVSISATVNYSLLITHDSTLFLLDIKGFHNFCEMFPNQLFRKTPTHLTHLSPLLSNNFSFEEIDDV
jgi:hypothetical protein